MSKEKEPVNAVPKQYRGGGKRDISLDIMRVIAIFFVIFNHTDEKGFWLYTYCNTNSAGFWIYLFISVFCKMAVPLFFMVSGAVMLGRQCEGLKQLYKKRIIKMIIVLLAISLFYDIASGIFAGQKIQIGEFLKEVYLAPQKVHLWYLYAYIGYLICLPFLQSMVENLNSKYFVYMIGITVIFQGLLPILNYIIWKDDVSVYVSLLPWTLTNTVLYPCIGYFFYYRMSIGEIEKRLPVMWIASLCGLCISCYMTYYQGNISGNYQNEIFFQLFVLIHSATMFASTRSFADKINISNRMGKFIAILGQCTFGVYLFHYFFLERTVVQQFRGLFIEAGGNQMLCTVLICCLIMAGCYLISYFLRSVPVIRKFL